MPNKVSYAALTARQRAMISQYRRSHDLFQDSIDALPKHLCWWDDPALRCMKLEVRRLGEQIPEGYEMP